MYLLCFPVYSIREEYVDVAKQFYSNPSLRMETEYPSPDSTLSHIVLFDVLLPVSVRCILCVWVGGGAKIG